MKVMLFQLDGKIPNLALMRIAAHHRAAGDEIELRVIGNQASLEKRLWETRADRVYASLIFTRSRPLANRLLVLYPHAIIGGSGWDREEDTPPFITSLAAQGITTRETDYSIYPRWQHSIGFTQRGCRMNKVVCYFCGVPLREGKARAEDSIMSIWRGSPWPKNLLLLDNDTFGGPNWREQLTVIRDGGFKVCWNQGINARLLTDEACEAICSVRYYDDQFTTRRFYTAWDNSGHEAPLFRGLSALVRYGMKPDNIMVYMLIGGRDTLEDRLYRRKKLREFGCRPYPMPMERTKELVGFQRWVIGAYDKPTTDWPTGVPWDTWVKADYQPANLGYPSKRLDFDSTGSLY